MLLVLMRPNGGGGGGEPPLVRLGALPAPISWVPPPPPPTVAAEEASVPAPPPSPRLRLAPMNGTAAPPSTETPPTLMLVGASEGRGRRWEGQAPATACCGADGPLSGEAPAPAMDGTGWRPRAAEAARRFAAVGSRSLMHAMCANTDCTDGSAMGAARATGSTKPVIGGCCCCCCCC